MSKIKNIYKNLSNILTNDVNPMAMSSSDIDGLTQPQRDKVFTNREEYEAELLRLQQQKFQSGQFNKIVYDAYQKSVFYESTKYASFMDYEQMEFFPEIATALNIMGEESTTLFEDGSMIKIESSSERIKNILEHLFNNILQINSTLPLWTRTMCKYGDSFIYLRTEDGKGVTKAMQMKNFEIRRVEGVETDLSDDSVIFEWEGKEEKFNEWQMLHFRLIGDDKKLPYGTSVLDKVRKVFKQLSLAEDAMMTYRISRAPERRVFKIDVGNIDPNDVESYVDKVSNKFKKSPRVTQNGGIDYRYNQLTQDEDYFIPTRGGKMDTVIETLPGAQNLSDIGDIEFLQNKLFSGLQVPKTFLGFQEASGDGKSLSMQDIRFSRTINKIQQAMLMELNKVAIIHLYLLGFIDDVNNFKLKLSNSSKQAELLQAEILGGKLDNFIKATTQVEGGFAPYSYTEASKDILGKSDDQIVLSIKQQFVEKAESHKMGAETIPQFEINTGIFDEVIDRYSQLDGDEDQEEEKDEFGDEFSGGNFGGGGFDATTGFTGGGFDEEIPTADIETDNINIDT